MREPVAPQKMPVSDDGPVAWERSSAARAGEATKYVETMIRQRPPARFVPPGRGTSGLTYIQLTGPAAPDGGYPWQEVSQYPPIKITSAGSGYTSAPSVSISGGGWTGWTIHAAVNTTTGVVTSVFFTGTAGTAGTANVQPTISFSGGGGTGAAASITDAQDANSPNQWYTTGATGDYSSAAYEASGCFGLPNDGAIYPAFAGPNGQLLFFCNPIAVGVTTAVSSYPTTINANFALQPQTVWGTQSEGASATFATSGLGGTYPVVYAYNLGTVLPGPGTQVIYRWTGTRWVFRYDVNIAGLLVTTHETPSTTLKIALAVGYVADSSDATLTQISAVTSYTLSASATNYVYLDASNALASSTSGWPGSGHYTKLAKVVTGSSTVSTITDQRSFVVGVQQS